MTRCIVCWTTVHLQHSPTDFTSPSHLRHPKTAMPNKKLKRGGEAERTPSGRDSARRRTECTTSPARDNLKTTPKRQLNFKNLDTFSASKFAMSSADEKKLDVKVKLENLLTKLSSSDCTEVIQKTLEAVS